MNKQIIIKASIVAIAICGLFLVIEIGTSQRIKTLESISLRV
jgi:hypothetical protein